MAQAYCGCCSDPIIPGDIEAVCWTCDDRNNDTARDEGDASGRADVMLAVMEGVGGFEKTCDHCDQTIILLPRKTGARSKSSRWTAWNHDGTRHRDD
jgi:hypothetical protein